MTYILSTSIINYITYVPIIHLYYSNEPLNILFLKYTILYMVIIIIKYVTIIIKYVTIITNYVTILELNHYKCTIANTSIQLL